MSPVGVRAVWTGLASTLAVLCLGLAGSPASAHTDLIVVDPADEAQLDQVPREVTLEFSEEMNPGLSAATVQVDGDAPQALDLTNGRSAGTLVATVPDAIRVGPGALSRWRVAFRVVAADGHPVAGESTFVVRAGGAPRDDSSPGAAAPEDAGQKAVEDVAATPSGDDRETGAPWALIGLPVAALILLLLAVLATMRLLTSDQDA